MGIPLSPPPTVTPPAGDQANIVQSGSLTGTGASSAFPVWGDFNIWLYGTFSATVQLQKTFNAGTTYVPVLLNNGSVASFTTPGAISLFEPERGVAYIANCTTYSSGTIDVRFSTTGLMPESAGPR